MAVGQGRPDREGRAQCEDVHLYITPMLPSPHLYQWSQSGVGGSEALM